MSIQLRPWPVGKNPDVLQERVITLKGHDATVVGLGKSGVAAVKLAWRAMGTENNTIRFPDLDPRGMLSDTPLTSVAAYVLLFVWLPITMLQVSASADLNGYAPEIPSSSPEDLEARAEQTMMQASG